MKEHDEIIEELETKELKEKAGITKNVRQKRRYDSVYISTKPLLIFKKNKVTFRA